MIADRGVERDVLTLEGLFYHFSRQPRVLNRLFRCITPDVVGRIVSSPEDHVWLNLFRDEV